jgi:hypothetical protein
MDHAASVRRFYDLINAGDIDWFGDDGLAHEHRGVVDALAMMQSLGVVLEGPPA